MKHNSAITLLVALGVFSPNITGRFAPKLPTLFDTSTKNSSKERIRKAEEKRQRRNAKRLRDQGRIK